MHQIIDYINSSDNQSFMLTGTGRTGDHGDHGQLDYQVQHLIYIAHILDIARYIVLRIVDTVDESMIDDLIHCSRALFLILHETLNNIFTHILILRSCRSPINVVEHSTLEHGHAWHVISCDRRWYDDDWSVDLDPHGIVSSSNRDNRLIVWYCW